MLPPQAASVGNPHGTTAVGLEWIFHCKWRDQHQFEHSYYVGILRDIYVQGSIDAIPPLNAATINVLLTSAAYLHVLG